MNITANARPVSASDIAKFFIWKATESGKQLTNKKLQKLLYYAQAWHLVYSGRPLFKEDIEAWVHGPAIPSVYHQYKQFGSDPIRLVVSASEIANIPSKDLLNDVWSVYGKFDANYLETLSHSESPWQTARENVAADEASTNIISLDEMKTYYSKALQHVEEA